MQPRPWGPSSAPETCSRPAASTEDGLCALPLLAEMPYMPCCGARKASGEELGRQSLRKATSSSGSIAARLETTPQLCSSGLFSARLQLVLLHKQTAEAPASCSSGTAQHRLDPEGQPAPNQSKPIPRADVVPEEVLFCLETYLKAARASEGCAPQDLLSSRTKRQFSCKRSQDPKCFPRSTIAFC